MHSKDRKDGVAPDLRTMRVAGGERPSLLQRVCDRGGAGPRRHAPRELIATFTTHVQIDVPSMRATPVTGTVLYALHDVRAPAPGPC